MATIRRLSDGDVRAIFESLHEGKTPPAHLKFQIVRSPPNGLKLSPPPYEYEGKESDLRSQKCSTRCVGRRIDVLLSSALIFVALT